jgi:hypothetical protein
MHNSKIPRQAKLTDTPRLAYGVSDVTTLTGFGRSSIFEALRNGALVRRKLGRRTFVLHDDLVAWLKSL